MYSGRFRCRGRSTRITLQVLYQDVMYRKNRRFHRSFHLNNHGGGSTGNNNNNNSAVLSGSVQNGRRYYCTRLFVMGNRAFDCRWKGNRVSIIGGLTDRYCRMMMMRGFSSEGNGGNNNDVSVGGQGKTNEEGDDGDGGGGPGHNAPFKVGSCGTNQHAQLGQQDQHEWLRNEKLVFQNRKKESPFLSKKARFKKDFLLRLVPWSKINVSWDSFPYYLQEHTKNLIVDCVTSHLKHHKYAVSYGSRLSSSSCRILLQSIPGTELYRERLVKALACDLKVPLLILDSSMLAPYDFAEESSSEADDSDDENEDCETGEEGSSETDAEDDNGDNDDDDVSNEDWASSEAKEDGSDIDDADADADAAATALKKLAHGLEDFEKNISGDDHENKKQPKKQSNVAEASQQSNDTLRKGDRVKYVGSSETDILNRRVNLGRIPTHIGPTSAYTFINKSPLRRGQRGEVFEVNGDKVAIIVDAEDMIPGSNGEDISSFTPDGNATLYWVDVQEVEHDSETEMEEWLISVEALCETVSSLKPVIVYFPDCSLWLARAAPKSRRKEFIKKVEEMFDQISGPVVMICGQNKSLSATKERERFAIFGRLGRLPIPLKRLTEGLKPGKDPKNDELRKLFVNVFNIHPPKEHEDLRSFNQKVEADRAVIIARSNWSELQRVVEDNDMFCSDAMNVETDGLILTKDKAEKVVGWAKNHYLSSNDIVPEIKGEKLFLPKESLETALQRLREEENLHKKPSQNLKNLARDEYESNFLSAVVSPDEIGVRFEDIGALEDVKATLKEVVILPMQRPELFSHGNLLRPCNGVLLFGPPGTGKTLLAKALATEAGANFLSITGSTLTSKWFGDAEKLTKALFSFASRLVPVIIFIDEVDSILGARGGAFEHEATRRMRNEFMAAWDGLRSKNSQRILVLGATNRPFDLDDAVVRRLPRRIYVDLPDAMNRTKILKAILSQERLIGGFDFSELACATEGYSGSDLKNLCIAAAYRPVQEVLEEEKLRGRNLSTPALRVLTVDDFIWAKEKVGPSVAYDAGSMNELRKWNDQYGEGGSRKKSPFGFGN